MSGFGIQELPADFDGLLVLSTERTLSRDEARRIAETWRGVAASGGRLAILDGGLKIEALDDEQLRELGLERTR